MSMRDQIRFWLVRAGMRVVLSVYMPVVVVLALANNGYAQGAAADLLGISEQLAKSASMDLTRLALQVAIVLALLLGSLGFYMLRLVARLAQALERLTSRPCMASVDDMSDFVDRVNQAKSKKSNGVTS